MLEDINNIIAEKHNLRALGWLIGGFRHMTNSKKPVTRLEDMKGLIIRTPRNRLMVETYKAFGTTVKPLSWSDTFNALKEGVIDGQENPYNVVLYSKFWKANQKYITNNGPFLWVGPILMNTGFYQSLPADVLLYTISKTKWLSWSLAPIILALTGTLLAIIVYEVTPFLDQNTWVNVVH